MNFFEKIKIIRKAFQAIIFKKKCLLSVSWNITSRCNLNCQYCNWPGEKGIDLDAQGAINLMKKVTAAGVKFINFSGGEPLLRDDLGEIINFCKSKGMYVSILSNGTLVREKIKQINKADMIKFSLDGSKSVNDFIRGKGVYDKVLNAIEICKKEKMQVHLTTVLSKYNLDSISHVLNVARQYDVGVYFKPADQNNSGNSNKDIGFILPDAKLFRETISLLKKEKIKGNKYIRNSFSGLKNLSYWPGPFNLNCLISLVSCTISPDGQIFICDDFPNYQNYLRPIGSDFRESFQSLCFPYQCKRCWNSFMTEFNSIKKFNFDVLREVMIKYKSYL